MNRQTRAVVLMLMVASGAAVFPSTASAQEDFRHLDEGRPTRVEDAYPLKYLEWEWQVGGLFGIEEEGGRSAGLAFELKTGLWRNMQVGAEAHAEVERDLGRSAGGLDEVVVHVLYNLNQEGRRMPALGVRADWMVPGGGAEARERSGGRLRGMATRTVGGGRVHVNGSRVWNDGRDDGNHWSAGIGFDRPLGLSSRALVGDVYGEFADEERSRVWADVGMRLQVSKTSVLDFGFTSRLDRVVDGELDLGFVIGFSRAFGFSGLVDVPPYPDPMIR